MVNKYLLRKPKMYLSTDSEIDKGTYVKKNTSFNMNYCSLIYKCYHIKKSSYK